MGNIFSNLLGGLLGGVTKKVDNKINNWLYDKTDGWVGSGPLGNYEGSEWDQKMMDIYEDIYGQAKNQQNPNFQHQTLTPNQVSYNSNTPASTIGAPGVVTNPTVTAPTWNPTQLGLDKIGDLTKYTAGSYNAETYNPQLMDAIAKYEAAKMNGQKIEPINGYTPELMEQISLAKAKGYDPQQYAATLLGDPKLVQDNPGLRDMLVGNMDTLQERAKTGFDQTDRMANNEVMQETAKQATRMGNAITEDAQARGVAGGGQELANRLMAAQGAAEKSSADSLGLLKEARDRKDKALTDASALGTTIRNTDVDISKANATFANQFMMANQDADNKAKADNTAAVNQAAQWNAGQENDFAKAQAQLDATKAAADQNAKNTALKDNQDLAFNTAKANADLAQETEKFNVDSANKAAEWNAAQENERLKANMDATNQASQWNTGQKNAAAQWNTGEANKAGMFNTEQENDRIRDNVNIGNTEKTSNWTAANEAGKWNSEAAFKAATDNANRQVETDKFNVGSKLEADKFNATNLQDINKFNTTNQNAQSRDNTNILNDFLTGNRDFNFNVDQANFNGRSNNLSQLIAAGDGLARAYGAAGATAAQRAAANQANQQYGTGGTSNGSGGGIFSSLLGGLLGGGSSGGSTSYNPNLSGAAKYSQGYNTGSSDPWGGMRTPTQTSTGGGLFSGIGNVLGSIGNGIKGLFGFEDGGMTPHGQPFVVGEEGPEWGINTDQGTMIAPMNTGHFETDMLMMNRDPFAGGKPVNANKVQQRLGEKNYSFAPKYNFTGRQ